MRRLPWARLVAEFAVIVIGVLVALLAESAWQERGERAEEREALERISAELALDSVIIADDVMWFEQLVPILEEARSVLLGELRAVPALAHEMGVLAYESDQVHEAMIWAQRSLQERRVPISASR